MTIPPGPWNKSSALPCSPSLSPFLKHAGFKDMPESVAAPSPAQCRSQEVEAAKVKARLYLKLFACCSFGLRVDSFVLTIQYIVPAWHTSRQGSS